MKQIIVTCMDLLSNAFKFYEKYLHVQVFDDFRSRFTNSNVFS